MAHAILDSVIPRLGTPVNQDGGRGRLLTQASVEKHDVKADSKSWCPREQWAVEPGETVKLKVNWPEGWGSEDHKEFINNHI